MAQEQTLNQCPICSKQASTDLDLEDHIIETHPDFATPEMQDSYHERHLGTAGDQEHQAA